MESKPCGECKWFTEEPGWCTYYNYCADKSDNFSEYDCRAFESKPNPTNGDKIRQGSNRELAEIFDDLYNGNKCKYCIHHVGSGACKLNPTPYSEYGEGYLDDEDCLNGFKAWLNSPAESGVEDE